HPGRLKPANTVLPECGWVLVKDFARIRRQDRPGPLVHFRFQLPGSPPRKSGICPESFCRFGLRNNAFHDPKVASHINPIKDRSKTYRRLSKSDQQEKAGWFDRPSSKQPMCGPLERSEIRQCLG